MTKRELEELIWLLKRNTKDVNVIKWCEEQLRKD